MRLKKEQLFVLGKKGYSALEGGIIRFVFF